MSPFITFRLCQRLPFLKPPPIFLRGEPLRRAALVLAALGMTCLAAAAQAQRDPATIVSSASAVPPPTARDPAAATAGNKEPPICWRGVRVAGSCVALTFDDGPDGTLTPTLLDILKERHIHATFFVVGQNAQRYPDLLRRELAEGHEIGNHSWDHPRLAQLSDELVRSELDRTRDAVIAACGKAPVFMRPPYGELTETQQRWVHDDLGYPIILWDVGSYDWRHVGPAAVEQRILERTHPGSIILDHDTQPDAIQAMPHTLDTLLARGFKFVTISQLIAMRQPDASTPWPPPVGKVSGGR